MPQTQKKRRLYLFLDRIQELIMMYTYTQLYIGLDRLVSVTAESCSLANTRKSAQHHVVGGNA
jgi:hypothetical protein